MTLKDRQIVVIGGSSGIGFEVARQARAAGATLTIAGRNRERLLRAASSLGETTATIVLDAHDETALERFFAELPGFDHLVSMVGDSMAGGFLATSPETMRHVLHSKFFTNWLIGRYAAARAMEGGSLVFTSGTGGRAQDSCASFVANLGIVALVQGLASELAPRVRVNAVAPTFMDTGFWQEMPAIERAKAKRRYAEAVPLRRLGTVEEVASAYLHLVTNSFITGQTLAVDGGVMLRR